MEWGTIVDALKSIILAFIGGMIGYFAARRGRNADARVTEVRAEHMETEVTEKLRLTSVQLLHTQQEQILSLSTRVGELLARVVKLEAERFELQRQNQNLQLELEAARRENRELKVDLDKANHKLIDFDKMNIDLMRRLAALENERNAFGPNPET
jgi:chromosome segregation ATPase